MSIHVIVGAQWGDEGKGKIADLSAQWFDAIVRYGGGANAGHTLVVGGERVVFHLMPSGALHPGKVCVLGQGMVIDPEVLIREVEQLQQRRQVKDGELLIAEDAFLVLPHHKIIDNLREESGVVNIGTTRRGIGPAYEDKIGRRSLQIKDLLNPQTFSAKLEQNLNAWMPLLQNLSAQIPDPAEITARYIAYGKTLAPYIANTREWVHSARKQGKRILLEGAQGTLLDIDHGTYPYVTSSSVIAAGACTGIGIGPCHVSSVLGVTKAYCTRVGEGPFPTEVQDSRLREAGAEYGATTGRPRRCGWLDIPLLRFAVQLNSIQSLALTKLDVLCGIKSIPVCVDYRIEGQPISRMPSPSELAQAEPIYEEHPGWDEPVTHCRSFDELPQNAQRYVRRIEALVECEVEIISIGPDREQTILRRPFGLTVD